MFGKKKLKEHVAVDAVIVGILKDAFDSEDTFIKAFELTNHLSGSKVEYDRDKHLLELMFWIHAVELRALDNTFDKAQAHRLRVASIELIAEKLEQPVSAMQLYVEEFERRFEYMLKQNNLAGLLSYYLYLKLGFKKPDSTLVFAPFDGLVGLAAGRWKRMNEHFKLVP